MQEEVVLTTALALSKKKYTSEEEELVKAVTKPGAQIEVVLPADMDPKQFDVAISAVSKVIAKATLQAQAMFPVLGRLLFVAQEHPELWDKKFDKFEDFRIATADKFGLARQTSYDALQYAKRWMAVLPPEEFKTVGRVKLLSISKYIGKGDEGKKTARDLIEFAKEHTMDELDAHMDKKLHTGAGATKGAFFKYPCSKRQLKDHSSFFNDPRVHAVVGSEKWGDIQDALIAECKVEWLEKGDAMVENGAEAAHQAKKEEVA